MEDLALAVMPRDYPDKVGHKAGDVTLEDGVVAQDDIGLLDHVGLKVLEHDWKAEVESELVVKITLSTGHDGSALVVMPADDRDEVGDKAGDVALENHIVALDDVFLVNICLIGL